MYKSALSIIKRLRKAGFTAYIAGGAVRDMLLGHPPKDYDIATNAMPDLVEQLIPHTLPVGKAFGVILARTKTHSTEIATFRKDFEYKDGRRPSRIEFTDEKEDALRRDFTINGMFYDPIEDKVIDYVGGQKDLKEKIIRFIGNPKHRMEEDHLRVLRAIRFKNTFQFMYEEKTFEALKKNVKLIRHVSKERLHDELKKMFSMPHTQELVDDLDRTDALEILMPELIKLKGLEQGKKHHAEGDAWVHTLLCLHAIPEHTDYLTRLGVLFHDIGKAETQTKDDEGHIHFYGHQNIGAKLTEKILKRLGFGKKEIETVVWLVESHGMYFDLLNMRPRRRHHWFKHESFPRLLEVMRADSKGCLPVEMKGWFEIHKLYTEWLEEQKNNPTRQKSLLSGEEIMEHFHIPEGKHVGELLKLVDEAFLDEKIHTKKEAIELIRNHIHQ